MSVVLNPFEGPPAPTYTLEQCEVDFALVSTAADTQGVELHSGWVKWIEAARAIHERLLAEGEERPEWGEEDWPDSPPEGWFA